MNEAVPDTLTVLPNRSLFRAARWMQRIFVGVAGIGILLGSMQLVGIPQDGNSASILRASLAFLLTVLLCGASMFLSEPERTGLAVDYARRIVNLFAFGALITFCVFAGKAATGSPHIVFPPARFALG